MESDFPRSSASTPNPAGTGACSVYISNAEGVSSLCPCLAYYEDPNQTVPSGMPVVCRECCHGRSLHNRNTTLPLPGSRGANVQSLFQKLVHGKSSADVEAARKETNSSLKKSAKKDKTEKKPKTERSRSSTSAASSAKLDAKVGNIVVITCGLDKKGALQVDSVPSSHDIQVLEAQGLAITSGKDPKVDLRFSSQWGTKRMNHFLRDKLPKLFDLFAVDDPWILDIDNDDDIPLDKDLRFPYVLLSKRYNKLKTTPSIEVTGARALQNSKRTGAATKESCLWIATRQSYEEFLDPASSAASAHNNSDDMSNRSNNTSGTNSSSENGASEINLKTKRKKQKKRHGKGKEKAVVKTVTQETGSESEETKFQKAGMTDEDDQDILSAVVASWAHKRQSESGGGPSNLPTTPPPRKKRKQASAMSGPLFNQPQQPNTLQSEPIEIASSDEAQEQVAEESVTQRSPKPVTPEPEDSIYDDLNEFYYLDEDRWAKSPENLFKRR